MPARYARCAVSALSCPDCATTQSNVETFQALTRARDWSQAAQIHGDFLRANMERAAEFTKCYFEVVQAVVASAASVTQDQARKAA